VPRATDWIAVAFIAPATGTVRAVSAAAQSITAAQPAPS
jgi:hypothetical protein